MIDVIVHPATNVQWQAVMQSLPHAILFTGDTGSGKKTLARHTATQILQVNNLNQYPYYLEIHPEKQAIGIDAIRNLQSFLNRKTTGSKEVRRIILIGDAHTMTIEAQNALLKSLEEPPSDTIIILTCSNANLLKPTIASRTQSILVKPISNLYAHKTITSHSDAAVNNAYYMSGGRVGLLTALLEQDIDHPFVAATVQAKNILKLASFDRLALVDNLSKQKQDVALLLEGIACVIQSGLAQSAIKNNYALTKKFHSISRYVELARDDLYKTANTKLLLTNLFLSM